MTAARPAVPDAETLASALSVALRSEEPLEVLRRDLVDAGSFPSEQVRVRDAAGGELKLFCKYESGASDGSYGHRGGVAYEADVYATVLERLGASTPRYLGRAELPGGPVLVLEAVEGGISVTASPDGAWLERAGVWLADFHRRGRRLLESSASAGPVRRHDAGYFTGWTARAAARAAAVASVPSWLPALARAYESLVPELTDRPTIIHGEFCGANILVAGGRIRPVDWESTAIAAGEIDLAALVEGWPADVAARVARAYGADDRGPTLEAARLYLHFRWLAARKTTPTAAEWRLEQLRAVGERLGIL